MGYVEYGSASLCFPNEVRGSSKWRIHRIVAVASAVARCRKGADPLTKWGQMDLPFWLAISCVTKVSSPPWILDPVFPRTAASRLALGPIVHRRKREGVSASACPAPDQRVEWARLDSMGQQ